MNGRATIFQALETDPDLEQLGVAGVLPNHGFDDVPRQPFIVISFGNQGLQRGIRRGPRTMEVWVHIPTELSRDFDLIDGIMAVVIRKLEGIEDSDLYGERVTCIRCTGTGRDLEDSGYNTITRNAGFEILAR